MNFTVQLRSLFLGLFIIISTIGIAQDTLKVMQYNLLYYGKDIYDCDSENNNIDDKNSYLITILDYVQPDIFCVNEMDASADDVDYLMDNVLNIDGVSYWKHANLSGSFSINMIYYNSEKFTLNSQESIDADPAQTDVYHLTNISTSAEFTVFVAHLKASSGDDDKAKRAEATQNVMDYIADKGAGNYIFMGDLNLYTNEEEAFQNLIDPSDPDIAFYDPADRIGAWHTSSSFADVHTQSTHTEGDCYVKGGMDDRFDFIMVSEDIKNGNDEIQYLLDSYETIGQDGNHYNKALNEGGNDAAPSDVIQALYDMSDHLPVSLRMIFGTSNAPITIFNKTFDDSVLTSGGWTQYSVVDEDRYWSIPSNTYGHNSTYYAKMSGYDYDNSKAVDNEDWIISPAFNADEMDSEVLTFWTAGKYDGPDLQLYYSSDYSGTGNPNDANWTEITDFHLSKTEDYKWESSGNIDISDVVGENVRIGIKYTSSESDGSRTWQVDDILLIGEKSTPSTSLMEREAENVFEIFPNPAKEKVQLIVKQNTIDNQSVQYQIYDITGKCILEQSIKEREINAPILISISSLKKGLYFIKVGNSTKKLIVE